MTESKKDMSFEDRVIDFATSSDTSLEEVKLGLVNRGLNPDRITERYQEFLSKMKKVSRLEKMGKAEEDRQTLTLQVQEFASRYLGWSREQLLAQIKTLAEEPKVYAFFRELDVNSMTNEDLRELLAQIEDKEP